MPKEQRTKPYSSGLRWSALSAQTRLYLILLAIGLVGAASTGFSMVSSATGGRIAQSLGMNRVASHFDNIIAILAWPVLLFFLILSAYAASELVKVYRAVNDPTNYGRRRRR